jgi:hypothetical protein
LKRDVKFQWKQEQKQEQKHAFQHLESKTTGQHILRYADFAKEFILITDDRNTDLGIVLSQRTLGNKTLHVDNYATKEHYIGYLKLSDYRDLPSNRLNISVEKFTLTRLM